VPENTEKNIPMNAKAESFKGKKILIPLLYDYYIFSFYLKLIPQLINDGFEVTIFTYDRSVVDKYSQLDVNVNITVGSSIMRALLNRSGKPFFRLILWGIGWFATYNLCRKYDFVIVPWDNKPIWYMMTRMIPSMTCHNSTEYADFDLTLEHMHPSQELLSNFKHKVMLLIDKIWPGPFLPKIKGSILSYSNYLIIDRLMGFRSPNYLHGFSGIDYFTMMGNRMKANFLNYGIGGEDHPTQITVTGSPSYEGILTIKKNFNDDDRNNTLKSLGINVNKNTYSFFLSPSSFSSDQIEEVAQVVETIGAFDTNSAFLLKFHPKTRKSDPPRFYERLSEFTDDVVLMTEFGGDELNARLILSSRCVFQKQGTVGFISMLFQTPLISYDLFPTDYFDDMYLLLGGSYHCKTPADLKEALTKISTDDGRKQLVSMQKNACDLYCYPELSPCGKISGIIQEHFRRQ